MDLGAKIYVTGHEGLLGSALIKLLMQKGYTKIITAPFSQVDLRNQASARSFIAAKRPDYIFLTAAKVGSIKDYTDNPAVYLYDNLMIQNNVMKVAAECEVKKVLFYSTACVYSDRCTQPIKESQLMDYSLDASSESYALAKLAGMKLAQYLTKTSKTTIISALFCNVYGADTVHNNVGVVAALVRRFADAMTQCTEEVALWGSGNQRREFLHVDDAARASLFLMNEYYDNEPINVGFGSDVSISELAQLIARLTSYLGTITYDSSMPEGARQKLLDSTKLRNLGWAPQVSLEAGIQAMIERYGGSINHSFKPAQLSKPHSGL